MERNHGRSQGLPVHPHAFLAWRACHVCIYVPDVHVDDSPAHDATAAVSFYGALNRVGGLGENDNAVGVTE